MWLTFASNKNATKVSAVFTVYVLLGKRNARYLWWIFSLKCLMYFQSLFLLQIFQQPGEICVQGRIAGVKLFNLRWTMQKLLAFLISEDIQPYMRGKWHSNFKDSFYKILIVIPYHTIYYTLLTIPYHHTISVCLVYHFGLTVSSIRIALFKLAGQKQSTLDYITM